MRQRFNRQAGLLFVALGLAAQPAQAGAGKSAAAFSHGASVSRGLDRALTAPTHPFRDNLQVQTSSAADALSSFTVAGPETKRPQRAEQSLAAGDERNESERRPPRERKSLTLFRFDSKHGDIAVQPVIGGLKGAQFSLGF